MIHSICGRLVQKTPTTVVLETGGIGYEIHIPVSSFDVLCPEGQEQKLLTHLHVREDAMQLYGFSSEGERKLFLNLISISGIGPKLAIGVLSGASPDEFKAAVHREDVAALSRIPGVGKKTAQRMIVELKEKIGPPEREGGSSAVSESSAGHEALLALVSLGYKELQAEKVIRRMLNEDANLPIEEIVRRALREM